MIILDTYSDQIIIIMQSRWCWNWQTGMVEGHVSQDVGVQVPPSALHGYRQKAVNYFNSIIFVGQYIQPVLPRIYVMDYSAGAGLHLELIEHNCTLHLRKFERLYYCV